MADLVLLTGITGFLGGHVAIALTSAGYRVRGSMRDLDKAEAVRADLATAGADPDALEFVALDLNDDRGWTEAMAGCRFLQHTASPFVTHQPRDRMELVRPAVDGTRRALAAALAAGVERTVLTSSIAAIIYGHTGAAASQRFDETVWTSLEGANVTPYVESKTRAENAAWDMMEAAERAKALVTINPSFILGPLWNKDPGTSGQVILRMLNGELPGVARLHLPTVDVRDVARAQVAAMTDPEAGGWRHIISDDALALDEMVEALNAAFPDFAKRLPHRLLPDWLIRLYGLFDADARGVAGELGRDRQLDNRRGATLLGGHLIAAEEAVTAMGQSLIDFGLVKPL